MNFPVVIVQWDEGLGRGHLARGGANREALTGYSPQTTEEEEGVDKSVWAMKQS